MPGAVALTEFVIDVQALNGDEISPVAPAVTYNGNPEIILSFPEVDPRKGTPKAVVTRVPSLVSPPVLHTVLPSIRNDYLRSSRMDIATAF